MKKPNISEGDRGKTITGSISVLFHGLTMTDECRETSYRNLLGTPVQDENGNMIGTITCLDMDNDRWYAKCNVDVLKGEKHAEILL